MTAATARPPKLPEAESEATEQAADRISPVDFAGTPGSDAYEVDGKLRERTGMGALAQFLAGRLARYLIANGESAEGVGFADGLPFAGFGVTKRIVMKPGAAFIAADRLETIPDGTLISRRISLLQSSRRLTARTSICL